MRGVTSDCCRHSIAQLRFQSTLPMRGVTKYGPADGDGFIFQSTLPMRGVTVLHRYILTGFEFQSTLPMRGVTQFLDTTSEAAKISIHTPHAGSDYSDINFFVTPRISIHTPHAGSDVFRILYPEGCIISIHTPHAGSDMHVISVRSYL